MNVELIGFAAAILSTTSFAPQAWRAWRTKHTQSISLPMYIIHSAGSACWLLYGIGINSWPITIANSITLLLALSILAAKLRHG